MRCHWLLARAAMLEARFERFDARVMDYSGFTHTISKLISGLIAPVVEANQALRSGNSEKVRGRLENAMHGARRLEKVAGAFRMTWVAIQRAKPDELIAERRLAEVVDQISDIVDDCFDSILNARIAAVVEISEREHLMKLEYSINSSELEPHLPSRVAVLNDAPLWVAVVELIANAVQHGDWSEIEMPKIELKLSLDKAAATASDDVNRPVLFLTIANPIKTSSQESVRYLFEKDRVSLGLSAVNSIVQVARNSPQLRIRGFCPSANIRREKGLSVLSIAMPIGAFIPKPP